jgi:hypothetical protein
MTITTTLAIYAAVLSTIVFLWDIRKWLRNNPRIAVKIEYHEGSSEDDEGWISYEIRNRGGKATTIEELMLSNFGWMPEFWQYFTRRDLWSENVFVAFAETVKLPVVLQPNGVWKGHSPLYRPEQMMRIEKRKLIEQGKLFYRIRCAHSDRLVIGKVKTESFAL